MKRFQAFKMKIFVTGGAGYIGSHTCKALAVHGHEVLVFDNLSRGHRAFVKWGGLIEGDIRDTGLLLRSLESFKPDAVVHFAALAYVGESTKLPEQYWSNNVIGSYSLLEAMRQSGTKSLVVSSSCAAYGVPDSTPIVEEHPLRPVNPYGATKVAMEMLCRDFSLAHGINTISLRYFNACGGDSELEIGELHDPEPHLIPRCFMAATGIIPEIEVFGSDYETPDGSCIRDYTHVEDLAAAHVAAVIYERETRQCEAFNLGAGEGKSVLEIIEAVRNITGLEVPWKFIARRAGDPAVLIADTSKAKTKLGWQAKKSDLHTAISSAWAWHRYLAGTSQSVG